LHVRSDGAARRRRERCYSALSSLLRTPPFLSSYPLSPHTSACTVGSYLTNAAVGISAAACTPCPPGSYSTTEAAASCTLCEQDKASSNTGGWLAATCKSCSGGTGAPPGSSECGCGVGSYRYGDECKQCDVGKANDYFASDTCATCAPGTSTEIAVGAATCTPCALGFYASSSGADYCSPCPPDRSWTEFEGTSSPERCFPPPADCIRVSVTGCDGTTVEAAVSGNFRPHECGWYNENVELYLYYMEKMARWATGAECGATLEDSTAMGSASPEHPFVFTDSSWMCAADGNGKPVSRPMSIECSLYIGQQAECLPDTYHESGFAFQGQCTSCPPHLERSFGGSTSTSVDDCYTTKANLFSVSSSGSLIVAFNSDDSDYRLVKEGGEVDRPADIEFIDDESFILSNFVNGTVVRMSVEGVYEGLFATVERPTGLLYIPSRELIAVASQADREVRVYALDGSLSGNLTVSSPPRYIALGADDDEILVTTSANTVERLCLPNTNCEMSGQVLSGGTDFRGITIARSVDSFFVADRFDTLGGRIYQCPLKSSNADTSDCTTFAFKPEGVSWDPYALVVNEEKRVLYAADRTNAIVHAFALDRSYLGHVEKRRNFLEDPVALAIRPGPFAPLSTMMAAVGSVTAGELVTIPLSIVDDSNNEIALAETDVSRLRVMGIGQITGTEYFATIDGEVTKESDVLAKITLLYAGTWVASLSEGVLNDQQFKGSPFEIVVVPAATDPAACSTEVNGTITAGEAFGATVRSFDAFTNPTLHSEDEFDCYLDDASDNRTTMVRAGGAFSYSNVMTKAKSYLLHIVHVTTQTEVDNSPFRIDVKPNEEDAASSSHNIKVGTELVSEEEQLLYMRVFPKDKFSNPITDADGYAVSIDGGEMVELEGPGFSYEHAVKAGYKGDVELAFTLSGTHINNSPVVIKVSPPAAGTDVVLIGGIVAGVLAVVSLIFYRVYQHNQKKSLMAISALNSERLKLQGEQSELQARQSELRAQNVDLQESLRKKKHSDAELDVMRRAMEEQNDDRADELKRVLVDSKDVKIGTLLGQGGMGKVFLAEYKGQQVAVKQLLAINEDNVKRFR